MLCNIRVQSAILQLL